MATSAYPDYSGDDVLKRHDELKNERAREEGTWRELALLLRPDDKDFNVNTVNSQRDEADIFDSTPLYALDNFVGGVFGQLVNPVNRWFELGVLEDPDLGKWQPIAQYLWAASNRVYGSLSPGVSGFYARAPAWFANIGAFGFGALSQEEWVGHGQIIDRAIPIGETYLGLNAVGDIDRVHREFALTGRQVVEKFGRHLEKDCREDARYIIVHAVYRNLDFEPNRLGPRGMPFASAYRSRELKNLRLDGGYFELPYHVPTWNERANSAYPTGPGHNARADAAMLQEMERTHLVAGQHAAEPLILVRDESVMSVADIMPNNIVYGAVNDAGKQLVQTLDRKQQLQLSMAQSEQRRAAIRTAFYYGIMQLVQRPQMTATEFLGFQEETLKLMAPNLVRIQTGGLSPFIARRWRILERAGQLPPPPPELAGKNLTIEYVSPLAKVQKMANGRAVLQWQQAVEQMALTDPAVRDWFNGDGAAPVIHEAFTAVPGVIRDAREVAAIRQARAQQAQQAAQLEQMGQAVTIAAEASHAQQAASLASQRGEARR